MIRGRALLVVGALVAVLASVAPVLARAGSLDARGPRAAVGGPRAAVGGPRAAGGLIADIPTGGHLPRSLAARAANIPYGGGPVLHWNRSHVIFWQPAGSGLTFESGYIPLIERFLGHVAADSHKPSNVYSLSGQYRDSSGPAAYDSTYGGGVVDTDPLPPSHCTEPSTGPGWTVCLTDDQLQTEIESVVSANHLPAGGNDVYFLVTPNGLGDCLDSTSSSCALGGSGTGYCAYHDQTQAHLLYAVIPYNAVSGHCQSDNPRPNGNPADPAISTISHEHNEMVTDPQDDAWIDGSGQEDGDLCIQSFGRNLGGSGGSAWNEVIHGGHYYLQEEWSNEDGACAPRDESDPVSFALTARTTAGKALAFGGHARDPDGSIKAYNWYFDDGSQGHRRVLSHAFKRAGVYRVVLRVTDSAGNWSFFSRVVRVARGPVRGRPGRAT